MTMVYQAHSIPHTDIADIMLRVFFSNCYGLDFYVLLRTIDKYVVLFHLNRSGYRYCDTKFSIVHLLQCYIVVGLVLHGL